MDEELEDIEMEEVFVRVFGAWLLSSVLVGGHEISSSCESLSIRYFWFRLRTSSLKASDEAS